MCIVCSIVYLVYVHTAGVFSYVVSLCVFLSEMHRTQTKYEDMFILKVFIFQFVNFYSSPVYIAFFKGRWELLQPIRTYLTGLSPEDFILLFFFCSSYCISSLSPDLVKVIGLKQKQQQKLFSQFLFST